MHARRRVTPLVAEARARLKRTDPDDPAHPFVQATYSEYAAPLIRIELRLAEYRRTRAGLREES